MKLKRRKALNERVDWIDKDEKLLVSLLKSEKPIPEIARIFKTRSRISLRNKIRRMRIKHDLFGNSYRSIKSEFTRNIALKAKPSSVFEAYGGAGHQTMVWLEHCDLVFTSELSEKKIEMMIRNLSHKGYTKSKSNIENWKLYCKGKSKIYIYQGDGIAAAASLNTFNQKINLIDLDTCGSTITTVPTFLVLTNPKHLVITHGEFHSYRFKRYDVLKRTLSHRIMENYYPKDIHELAKELDKAVKLSALRAHNETQDSFWLKLKSEEWLSSRSKGGMLRRYYVVSKPPATADCLNILTKLEVR